MSKCPTRLGAARAEVAARKKLRASAGRRLAVKRLLDEAERERQETEEKVAEAMAAVVGSGPLSFGGEG